LLHQVAEKATGGGSSCRISKQHTALFAPAEAFFQHIERDDIIPVNVTCDLRAKGSTGNPRVSESGS
jgi:hypothetical protein